MAFDAPPEMVKWMANIPEKTGKPVEEWLEILRASGLAKHGELLNYLKNEHGFGHGYANAVVHVFLQSSANMQEDRNALVDKQYTGSKAGLRPLYDQLSQTVSGFGADVELVAQKAYVSVRRKKQFAIFQPSTATRMDVGIKLKGTDATERLEAGGFNGMVSHKVKITSADEIDDELIGWLRAAYEQA